MSEGITIPPEAIDAAARAICETENGPCKCMPDECGCTYWKAHAIAALRAGIAAWPGVLIEWHSRGPGVILPLPTENTNAESDLVERVALAIECAEVGDAGYRDLARAALAVVLEEAAQACEEQEAVFAQPEYAGTNPRASFEERFACRRCAAAIRAMIEKNETPEDT